jgi:serine/threonine protein kinase
VQRLAAYGEPVEGTAFGRYRLVELLGRGGMGEVWRAHDTDTDRVVAIKLLPPHFSDNEEFQKRFRREAHAAAGLNSPHVVPIHNYGEIDGRLYVDMRLIEGRDLQAVLAEGPLEPKRAVRIIEGVALALHAAHQVGLVHRDVKPSNILLDRNDFAYLIDFGIARAIDETRMTQTGNMIGTFQYIAPERLGTGAAEDGRVDIYSMAGLVAAHLSTPPPRPSITRPGVPPQVDEVIAAGMAKDPDQRYATTVELADAALNAITTPIGLPTQNLGMRAAFMASPAAPTMPATEHAAQQQGADVNVAATQQRPPPPETATPPPPPPGPPTGDQRNRRRRRIALAGGAAVIATIIMVLLMVFTNGGERANRPSASPTSTVPPNTGPFTGVYRTDFGPSGTNGKLDEGATPSTGQWAVRSACRSSGCVATATATGGPTLQSAFVFDDIGGQWHAVGAAPVASPPPGVTGFHGCNSPAEYWTVITLQIRPDGTLAGQYRASGAGGDNCETERTVTFTRIGDVDLNSLPDPASQAVRVASPAEAWHGRYHGTHTPDDTHRPFSWDGTVETDCLRTGERCISSDVDLADSSRAIFTFADGKWIYSFDRNSTCLAGGSPRQIINQELPLPQPPQDPITLLAGHGHRTVIGGACAGSYDEELRFERTGD